MTVDLPWFHTLVDKANVNSQADQCLHEARLSGLGDIGFCFFRILLHVDLLSLADTQPETCLQIMRWKSTPRELLQYTLEILSNHFETEIRPEQLLLELTTISMPLATIFDRKGHLECPKIKKNNLVTIKGRLMGVSSKLTITYK